MRAARRVWDWRATRPQRPAWHRRERPHADGQYHKPIPQRHCVDGQHQLGALPPADHPAQPGRQTRLHSQGLAFGTALVPHVVIPLAPLLAYGLLLAVHPSRQQTTDGRQRAGPRPHQPQALQRHHTMLGLAHMRHMRHDRCPPWVETGLAKHGFPPRGCRALHTPQYAGWREVTVSDFQKPSPCMPPFPP
jgi:hypothetical protein